MQLTRNQIILIAIGGAIVIAVILAVVFGTRQGAEEAPVSGEITVWGVFDSRTTWDELIAMYNRVRPNVHVRFQLLNSTTYEDGLINALAAGSGPDVFMFHNTWLPKHFSKLRALPSEFFPLSRFRSLFPTVAEQDFAPDGVIYAMPLYIDTLAMLYNRDIFDTAGIALPPATWRDFQAAIPKLRTLDSQGRLVRAAAAIGGSNQSINRGSDIAQLLMLQAGVEMVDATFTRATFSATGGTEAVRFYTSFANPADPFYTWDESFGNSLDVFAEGRAAVIFNYAHQIDFLKQKNPFLNFDIAPMPQPASATQTVNFPSYWGLAVSGQSRNPLTAWDFIAWLTGNEEASRAYLERTNRPPAIRSLIAQYQNHAELGVFARQALTARSWPQIDNRGVDRILSDMISDVISGRTTALRATQEAEAEVSALMRR